LKILLNGEAFATDAKTLDELCARLGFAEAKIATAVNGTFVAALQRSTTKLARADEIEIVAPRQGG
jgi:sulfur carrier protein